MNRIYHPYWKWEEVKFNMWGKVDDREKYLQMAIDFTGDHEKYGHWMRKVVDDWKYSTEHNLSNTTQNRKAWIGHAAVALAIQCPEDIVREAWGHLTDQQRADANNQADLAIKLWESRNV